MRVVFIGGRGGVKFSWPSNNEREREIEICVGREKMRDGVLKNGVGYF